MLTANRIVREALSSGSKLSNQFQKVRKPISRIASLFAICDILIKCVKKLMASSIGEFPGYLHFRYPWELSSLKNLDRRFREITLARHHGKALNHLSPCGTDMKKVKILAHETQDDD